MKMSKIIISKNGPYLVTGDIPLIGMSIIKGPNGNVYKETKTLKTDGDYALCRCGKSNNKPFCDGSHNCGFDGTLTASKEPIKKRSKKYEGRDFILEDAEDLCAYARFCHTYDTDVWNIVESGSTEEEQELAKKLAFECPSGRLVLIDKKTNKVLEPDYEPSIAILYDEVEKCMGPIWVRGCIPIEDENGKQLEVRNRVTLCRCGNSDNKPYCDASHISKKS